LAPLSSEIGERSHLEQNMSLSVQDVNNIVAAVETVVGLGISAIPGNPVVFVPEEKILLNDAIAKLASMIETRLGIGVTATPAATK